MKPTEELMHEHEVILHVLKSTAKEAQRIRDGEAARVALIESMIDFYRNFTDKCHHAKEEKHLFPALEKKGMAHNSGPIAVMLAEHGEGRQVLSRLAERLSAAKQREQPTSLAIGDDLSAYAQLLENHIAKENNVLFPLAEKLLDEPEMTALGEAFAKVEDIETGEGVHEKYHQLAHNIVDQA